MSTFILLTGIAAGLLLAANLALTLLVILKLRGRGLDAVDRRDNRPFIAGWQHKDLRPLMVVWALVAVLLACSGCGLIVGLLA